MQNEQMTIGRPSTLGGTLGELAEKVGGTGPLARQLGTSVRSIQRWNQGKGHPTTAVKLTIGRLCAEHKVTLEKRFFPPESSMDPVALGIKIRAAREDAGMTQAELADELETTQPHLSAIEKGQVLASDEFVKRVLAVCEADVDALA